MRSLPITIVALLFVSMIGCNSEENKTKEFTSDDLKKSKEIAKKHEEEHKHVAPHGGTLVELGKHQYSAEFVVNHDEHKLTIYVLDAHAENAVAIEQKEIVVSAVINDKEAEFKVAAVSPGDDGKASQFELVDEDLVHYLDDEEDAEADFTIKIDGKDYSGEFEHHHDEDGEHKHGKKDAHDDDDEDHKDGDKDKDDDKDDDHKDEKSSKEKGEK